MERPRLAVPEAALTPCVLTVLPTDREITWAEMEAAYALRGQHLVVCELARRLALDTLMAEREADDRALPARDPPRRLDPG